MDLEANTSLDSNHGSTNGKNDSKKQQFTTKQRIDMYAFCVLELELRGNTVSIKKQQQAIQKALKREEKLRIAKSAPNQSANNLSSNSGGPVDLDKQQTHANNDHLQQPGASDNLTPCNNSANTSNDQSEHHNSFPQHHQYHQVNQESTMLLQPPSDGLDLQCHEPPDSVEVELYNHDSPLTGAEAEKKTLLQLQEEISKTRRCYSDYQKIQVLTSSMLRDVQKRFAKYYPDAPCPSRTTIKHVFMKCVENGTVDNVKNPRKPTKIPNGSQIEQILNQEPQISLREMAKRLNVSTGTVSRRCRSLGIVPESVTLKHQQMALAKRQKQMKQKANRAKASEKKNNSSTRQQQAASNYLDQSNYDHGMF